MQCYIIGINNMGNYVGIVQTEDYYKSVTLTYHIMKIKFALVVFISVFTLCFKNSKAQTNPPPTVAQLQTAANFTPSQLKAAERLFNASRVLENLQKAFANVMQVQAQQIPEDKRAVFISVMQKFCTKYFTDDVLKKGMVPIYASLYSEVELNQI